MNIRQLLSAFVCAGSALLATAQTAAGLAGFTLVRPEPIADTDAFVLEDVRGLLGRGLGAEVPVCTAAAAPAARRIFFGIPAPGFDTASLANQEHVVAVADGDVYLFGGGTNGTRYAAYDFLQGVLGYRFFDARGGVRVPDLKVATLPDGVRRRRFAFVDRNMTCWKLCSGANAAMYLFRHGLNGATDGSLEGFMKRECGDDRVAGDFRATWPASHSLVVYLPRNHASGYLPGEVKRLVDANLEKTHPEYFSLQRGRRVFGHQRCLSNPDARALLKKVLFARMDATKRPTYFDLSAGDTPGAFCECEGCKALERKYGTTAGPLLDAILEFCPEVARRWPQHGIKMLVYRKDQTQRPPNLTRLPDNFVPQFAPIDDDFSKDWTHPGNADTLADLKRWCGMSRRSLMWYYPNPYGGITPPLGNLERLANDMRIMHEAGITGLTFEHDQGVQQMTGFSEMQSYVIVCLWDDMAQDWRQLVREFADFEYGAAANGVLAYLDELETLRKGCRKVFPWDASRSIHYYDYITPERLMRWEGDFDRMETLLAGDRTRLRNLRRIRYNLDNAVLVTFRKVRKALGDAAPKVETVADRVEAIAKEIAEDCYDARHAAQAKEFLKSVADGVFLKRVMGGAGSGGLPESLFGGIPPERMFVTIPISYDGGRKSDPKAAYGLAALFEGVKRPEAMKMPFVAGLDTVLPGPSHKGPLGRGVDAANIGPRGEYRFYEMGDVVVTQNCYVRLGDTYWFQANLSDAYVEGSFNRAKVYASLKFQGPTFYPEDTKSKNQVWCDRIVVVQQE